MLPSAHSEEGNAARSDVSRTLHLPDQPEILRKLRATVPVRHALEPILPTGDEEVEARQLARRFWLSVVLGIPVVILAMSPMAGIDLIGARCVGWLHWCSPFPVLL